MKTFKELREATMSNLDFVIDQLSNSMEFYDVEI